MATFFFFASHEIATFYVFGKWNLKCQYHKLPRQVYLSRASIEHRCWLIIPCSKLGGFRAFHVEFGLLFTKQLRCTILAEPYKNVESLSSGASLDSSCDDDRSVK